MQVTATAQEKGVKDVKYCDHVQRYAEHCNDNKDVSKRKHRHNHARSVAKHFPYRSRLVYIDLGHELRDVFRVRAREAKHHEL